FHDGVWGTVCDDQWDMNVANAACRQLHFSGAVEVLASGVFGEGNGKIWMDDLSCTGVETSLLHCTFPGWGINNCGHGEDVGVRCKSVREYDLPHKESFSHQLGELFDSGRDCDLNITVMVDNHTLNTICAHSPILSLNSDLRSSQPDFSSLVIQTTSDCSQHARKFVRYK
uniref:SRCR domain-containing protein n=1 Tax=Mola mola TaxID=94237 RepID=A0A3Q3XER5_MOLML